MKSLFRKLGLTDKEQKLFLTLLELGAQPVSVIAKQLGLPRSSTYLLLEKLRDEGLVEEFERKGMKYVKCIPVSEIDELLKARERSIEETRDILKETLPELEKIQSKLSITPKVQFHEGEDAVMKMLSRIFTSKEFCAFFNPASVKQKKKESHYDVPKILDESGGTARELAVDNPDAHEYKELFETKKHQVKILPKHMQFTADILKADNKLYMTAYDDNQVSAVEVTSPALANAFQVLFDGLWERIE